MKRWEGDEPRHCIDGGTCHHDCGNQPCWREANAAPLSSAGSNWDEVRQRTGAGEHAEHDGAAAAVALAFVLVLLSILAQVAK